MKKKIMFLVFIMLLVRFSFGQASYPEYIITPHTVQSGTYYDTIPYAIFEYLSITVTKDILSYRMQVNPNLEPGDVYDGLEGDVTTLKNPYSVLFDPPLDPAFIFDFTIYKRRYEDGYVVHHEYILEKEPNAPLRRFNDPDQQISVNTWDDLYPNSNRFLVYYNPAVEGYKGYDRIAGDFLSDDCCGLWLDSPNNYIGAAGLIYKRIQRFTPNPEEIPLVLSFNKDGEDISGHKYSEDFYYYWYRTLDLTGTAAIVRMPKPESNYDRYHHTTFELIYYTNHPDVVGFDFPITDRYEVKYTIYSGRLPHYQDPQANYETMIGPQIRKLSNEEVEELEATLPYFPQFIKLR